MTVAANNDPCTSMLLEQIQVNIDKAQHSFVSSKSSAAEAAAHTYLVWLETMSPLSSKGNAAWIKGQIDDRNIEIKRHNADEKSLRKRAKDYLAGKHQEDDEGRAQLEVLVKLTDADWATRRKVSVDAKASANEFTTVVKFVLNFDRPADASVTSRFATVLEWIHARFEGVEVQDASQITDEIKSAGGFEVALVEQRNKDNLKQVKDDAKERAINVKAVTAMARNAVETSPAIASFDMRIKNAERGIVLLVGRYADGTVDVVDNLSVEREETDILLSHVSDDLLPSPSDNTDFIAHVLELGDLVTEGKVSDKTHEGTVAGVKLTEKRTLTLRPCGEQNAELTISAIHADSSAIIKATPEPTRVKLGKSDYPVVMETKCFRFLEKILRDRTSRFLTEITHNQEPESIDGNRADVPLSWVAQNNALTAEGHANGRRAFTWEDMTRQESRPLDVDNFKPQFNITVTAHQLRHLYQERLKIWLGKEKTQKPMTLHFHDSEMTYEIDGDDSLETACVGNILAPVKLEFRPRDLHGLVLKLTHQTCDKFEMSGDSGGLLCVSWSDHLGTYSVYMPTTNKDGGMQTRRIAPMQVLTSSGQAAA